MPNISGKVRLTPKFSPEARSIMLFGPGVIEVARPNMAAADRMAGDMTLGSHPLGAPAHGGDAGARDLDEADHRHHGDEALDLLARAGELEDEGGERRVEGAGPEGGGEPERLDPVLALAGDLDEG